MHKKRSHLVHTIPLERMAPSVQQFGHWAFLIGVLVAIIGGFLMNRLGETAVFSALFALGVVVGLLNITLRETTDFLVATIALIMAGVVNLRLIPYVGALLQTILNNILVFVVPAAVIVALRAVWVLASRE